MTVASSLLAVTLVGYGVSVPALLASGPDAPVAGAPAHNDNPSGPAQGDASDSATTPEEGTDPQEGDDAADAEGAVDPTDPKASLDGEEDLPFGDDADMGLDADAPSVESPSDPSGSQGGTSDGGTNDTVTPSPSPDPEPDPEPEPEDPGEDDPFTKVPTEAEEAEFRAFLVNKESLAEGYLAEVNACVADFDADCYASLSVRQGHQRTCDALSSKLLTEYLSVRDHIHSNYSRYADDNSYLIAMFRCLGQYLATYENAWERNVTYEDPTGHESDFMAPIQSDGAGSANVHLAEYYRWKGELSL